MSSGSTRTGAHARRPHKTIPLSARILGAVAACLCASCLAFRPPDRAPADLPFADEFTLYPAVEEAPERWWESFGSDELNGLIDRALEGNLTVQQAAARLLQTAAVAKQAGALHWPSAAFDADSSYTWTHTELGQTESRLDRLGRRMDAIENLVAVPTANPTATPLQSIQTHLGTAQRRLGALENLLASPPATETTVGADSWALALTTSYEVDLWGRVRASHESARRSLEAAREDLYAARQSLAGQVALTWLDLVGVWKSIDVNARQLDANRTTLDLVELRYRKGLATALDVYQQKQAVARTQAVLPLLEAREAVLKNELALLAGTTPQTDLELAAQAFPAPRPLPDPGLPMDLLANRPDVRAAGCRLRAADWQVSAAKADRLPALRLTASARTTSGEWDKLFDNWLAALAASVTGPIFEGGRRKAEVARQQALAAERLAVYKQTVLTAAAEVENALIRETKQAEYIALLRGELEVARAAHREALGRYRKGLNDYLPVLNALTSVQALERTLVQAEQDRLAFRVQLHLALGGVWMRDDPAGPAPPESALARRVEEKSLERQ